MQLRSTGPRNTKRTYPANLGFGLSLQTLTSFLVSDPGPNLKRIWANNDKMLTKLFGSVQQL